MVKVGKNCALPQGFHDKRGGRLPGYVPLKETNALDWKLFFCGSLLLVYLPQVATMRFKHMNILTFGGWKYCDVRWPHLFHKGEHIACQVWRLSLEIPIGDGGFRWILKKSAPYIHLYWIYMFHPKKKTCLLRLDIFWGDSNLENVQKPGCLCCDFDFIGFFPSFTNE